MSTRPVMDAVIPGRRAASSPESITPAVVDMDSGLATSSAPWNDALRLLLNVWTGR